MIKCKPANALQFRRTMKKEGPRASHFIRRARSIVARRDKVPSLQIRRKIFLWNQWPSEQAYLTKTAIKVAALETRSHGWKVKTKLCETSFISG